MKKRSCLKTRSIDEDILAHLGNLWDLAGDMTVLFFNVDWKRNVQILRSAQDDTFCFVVILSGAKDLYEANSGNVLMISQENVKNQHLVAAPSTASHGALEIVATSIFLDQHKF